MAAALVGRDAIVTRTSAPSRHERACQTLISRRVAVARASKGTVASGVVTSTGGDAFAVALPPEPEVSLVKKLPG